jgi:iron(III) transport system substrate-binding protein
VRGQYPIAIGIAPEDFDALAREGVKAPIAGLGLPRKLSLGSGGIQYINNAPHPNAARVFMNWILTQDAQTKIVEYTRANVRRNDVPEGNPETLLDPALLHTYVPHQTEPLLPQRQHAQQLGQQLIK